MKTALSLVELAQQIQDRAARKEDFIADTRDLEVVAHDDRVTLGLDGREFEITDHTHSQICDRLEIGKKYYDRCRAENPKLLATNIRTWFQEQPERRMVRTLDGSARAFTSDKFNRLDDGPFAEVVLPVIAESGAEVRSAAITDTKTHLKVIVPSKQREIRAGDVVSFGLGFSNSEVGAGALEAYLFTERLICTNGMRSADDVYRHTHVGARHKGRDLGEIFKLDTLQIDAQATMLKLRDYAADLLSDRFIDAHVERLTQATEVKLSDPIKAVEKLTKVHSLLPQEQTSVLTHLLKSGDFTLFGIAQAVTRTAEDIEDYNRATSFEALGGKLIELKRPEYKELAIAA